MNTLVKRLAAWSALLTLLLPLARAQRPVADTAAADKPWPRVALQQVFDAPTFFQDMAGRKQGDVGDCFTDIRNAGDGSNRLYFVQRTGKIWTFENGNVLGDPFLDASDLTTTEFDRGMMSLVFAPDYKTSHTFYVWMTSSGKDPGTTLGDVILERFKGDPKDPYHALKGSGEILMDLAHTAIDHNGGQLVFGKDGMLYITTGDGGRVGPEPSPAEVAQGSLFPYNLNGQNLNVLFGKLLRIDVNSPPDAGKKYHVPADNPFVGKPNTKPEIWAYGLRNPFRMSIDPVTGDIYLGGVGLDEWESIYFQPGSSKGGENYGWSVYEGTHENPYRNDANEPPHSLTPAPGGVTFPIAEFGHRVTGGNFVSICGGYVYRGSQNPDWVGTYFFSDWGVGEIWASRRNSAGTWEKQRVDVAPKLLQKAVTFGTDEKGDLYVTDFADGKIYKLVEAPPEVK